MLIRKLKQNETELIKEFLYEAIFIPEGMEPPERSIIERPELRLYYEDFGSGRADHCLVAEDDGRPPLPFRRRTMRYECMKRWAFKRWMRMRKSLL